MRHEERAPDQEAPNETQQGGAAISFASIQTNATTWKISNPSTVGLAFEIANTSTSDLREQVRLLRACEDVFGHAGTRRRRLAVAELGRRLAAM